MEFACCYCTEPIDDASEAMGVAHIDFESGEFVQQWFSHIACFRMRLRPEAQIFKPRDDDDDDLEWETVETSE